MPDLVDRLQTLDSGNLNRSLEQAVHDRDWANSFSNTPPIEVLRANRNYVDLLNQAVDRKQELMAQTDNKAAELYFNTQKFQQWKQDQPLRDELLKARINATGATERFHHVQDAETMNHVAGFADYMLNAPPVGTQERHDYILQGVTQFPRIITTQGGKDMLKNLATEQDSVAELRQGYGLTRGQLENPVSVAVGDWKTDAQGKRTFEGSHTGKMIQVDTGKNTKDGTPIYSYMSRAEYERFGGKLAPADQNATTVATEAPKAIPDNPYRVGGQYGGLRYKGGNPSDESSWEKVK